MKSIFILVISSICAILFFAGKPGFNKYVLAPDFVVSIDGTSNLHDWKEKVEIVKGEAEVKWYNNKSFDLNLLIIRMHVRSIKSDKGSVMDNNTYKALKADNNPEIIFTLLTPITAIRPVSQQSTVSVKGSLFIAGVTRPIVMQVKVFMKEQTKLTFEGTYKLKMTDYKVDPPGAFFGTLKTGNEIELSFRTNFILSPDSEPISIHSLK